MEIPRDGSGSAAEGPGDAVAGSVRWGVADRTVNGACVLLIFGKGRLGLDDLGHWWAYSACGCCGWSVGLAGLLDIRCDFKKAVGEHEMHLVKWRTTKEIDELLG